MLEELAVSDLGVIDALSLVFAPGMTALTGETGAGKTMIVGAIGLLAGQRADPGVVRPGAEEATIQGRFIIDDEELVLTRVVPRSGRSRAYRDGRLVTAAEMAEHAAGLVDLHGQHAHVALLEGASQRRALDRFAGVDLTALEAARAAARAADDALSALGGDVAAREREAAFLRFQLDEIDAVGLTDPDEDDRLLSEESLLADADAHRAAAAAAEAALGTDGGARDQVAAALGALADRTPFAPLAQRLLGVEGELEDVVLELRSAVDGIEADPERLSALQDRRAQLADLRRRYGGGSRAPLADVFAAREELATRLADLDAHADRAAAAEAARTAALAERDRAAAAVGAQRRAAAPGLAAAVQEHLVGLALPKAEVSIEVGDQDPGDDVQFLLALNPGLPAAPLARAASGGELARTMLALRLVVGASVSTLVFDEVDAGVGGTAARSVGRALAALALRKQVLVVTHLPQVAAFADAQISLAKEDDGITTRVRAEPLTGDGRVRELARMLSGLPGSDTGFDHAEELLASAAAERGR
jgi:DNA repair protein RecN (Recombination protein N)